MGIERLNKAVEAAGFAMVAEDDDMSVEVAAPREVVESRALVPVAIDYAGNFKVAESPLSARVTTWLRGYIPTFGGRAPA